jgi:KUP system potassium uptake protein
LTGAEALYADMGHFGLKPIRMGWVFYCDAMLALELLWPGCNVFK